MEDPRKIDNTQSLQNVVQHWLYMYGQKHLVGTKWDEAAALLRVKSSELNKLARWLDLAENRYQELTNQPEQE